MFRHSAPGSLSPRQQPFLYLTAALVAGILIDRSVGAPRWLAVSLCAASVVAALASIITNKSMRATLALLVGVAAAGALLSAAARSEVDGSRLKALFESHLITPDEPVELTGVLGAPPEPAPGAFYLDLEAESIRFIDGPRRASGRARLMVPLADEEATGELAGLGLDYGSRVRVLLRLEAARRYSNPGSVDFNEFLERHGYDLKGTIKSPLLIEPLGRARRSMLQDALYRARLRLMGAIDLRFKQPVAGTLKAMLAGNRYFLDDETAERLREGSTFHTLVVAGLHVGIIAWALLALVSALSPRGRRSSQGWLAARILISLLALWAYAVMVGLAPPVVRASVMISVGLTGPLLFRRPASINTVALAAFIMLVTDTTLVADPAFQLSFAAVAGIALLALPLIDRLRMIGGWRPSAETPHPPRCPRICRALAEALFWNERAFEGEMRRATVRYRLDKSKAARLISRSRLQPVARGVALLLITSTAIQVMTLPMMAFYFNRVAPIGILLNVAAGLLTMVLMLASLATLAVGAASAYFSSKLVSLVGWAHRLLTNSVVPFTHVAGATFRVAHYEGRQAIVYALYFVPLAAIAAALGRWRPVDRFFMIKPARAKTDEASKPPRRFDKRLRPAATVIVCATFAVLLVAVIRPPTRPPAGNLVIHFLDVGQGDSALVVFPRGATMLVDGGGEISFRDGRARPEAEADSEAEFKDNAFPVGEIVVSRLLWSQGRDSLDYVLATHADADHIGGLADVVKNFGVGEAVVGRAPADDVEFARFARALARRRIPLGRVCAGDTFDVQGARVDVLWPPRPTAAETSGNDDSVVLRITYGSTAVLLTGDIEQAGEEALVRSGLDLRADVLKVAHHGSKTSSTEGFIDRVCPRYGVISVGERSRFGHPHAAVVDRYLARGVRLYQTGRDGMLTIESDGQQISITSYKTASR